MQGESEDNELATSWRVIIIIIIIISHRAGDVLFRASYFLPFRFGFPSPGAFNLLVEEEEAEEEEEKEEEKEEEVGAEDEEKKKRSLPRIKFVPSSAGSRQWRAQRGLGESQQGPRTQMLLPGAGADTHAQSSTPLCSRLEFLSLARGLSRSPLSTPPLGLSVKAKGCTPRILPATGRGRCGLGRVRDLGTSRLFGRRARSLGRSNAPYPAGERLCLPTASPPPAPRWR